MPCWLLREGSISDLKFLLIENKNNKKASKRVMKNDKGNNKKAVKIRNFKFFFPFHKHLLFTGQQGKGWLALQSLSTISTRFTDS